MSETNSKVEESLVERLDILRDAVGELLEVATLRGDNNLPSPPDDPLLWTARMQDAWDCLQYAFDETDGNNITTNEETSR